MNNEEYLKKLGEQFNSKEEVIKYISSCVIDWTTKLLVHENKEEYEECSAIKQIIDINVEDAKQIMEMYFTPTDDDIYYLDDLAAMMYKILTDDRKI